MYTTEKKTVTISFDREDEINIIAGACDVMAELLDYMMTSDVDYRISKICGMYNEMSFEELESLKKSLWKFEDIMSEVEVKTEIKENE